MSVTATPQWVPAPGLDPILDTVACAVDRGMALLNVSRPDWHEDIDTDALNFYSEHLCVLGQVYGSFTDATVLLGLRHATSLEQYGFACRVDWHGTLVRAWRLAIEHRRLQMSDAA